MARKFLVLAALASLISLTSLPARADLLIGDWESGSTDSWIDWGTQAAITGPKYTFSNTIGVTHGSSSVHVTQAGYNQDLAIKLQSIGAVSTFYNNDEFQIDITYPAQTFTSGFQQIYQLALNAPGFGFGDSGLGNPIPVTNVGYGGPTGDHTYTLTFDYSSKLARNGGPIASNAGYAELIFSTNGDSNHPDFYFDNARLVTLVPEPASLTVGLALFGLGALRRSRVRA